MLVNKHGSVEIYGCRASTLNINIWLFCVQILILAIIWGKDQPGTRLLSNHNQPAGKFLPKTITEKQKQCQEIL